MNARRSTLLVLAAAFSVLTFALDVGPALATKEYLQSVTFGRHVNQTNVHKREEQEAKGEPVTVTDAEENICTRVSGDTCQSGQEGSGKGEFSAPVSIAVNNATGAVEGAGDVYVSDLQRGLDASGRIERFSSAGVYLGQFDGTGTFEVEGKEQKGTAAPRGQLLGDTDQEDQFVGIHIAVDNSGSPLDPSAGDLYVVDTGHSVIDKFSPSGEYLSQLTETEAGIPFGQLSGVTVDPAGNLWVEDERTSQLMIDEFSDSGNFIKAFKASPGRGPQFAGLTADSKYIYSAQDYIVRKFEAATGREVANFTTPQEAAGEGVFALAIDPSNEDLLLDDNEHTTFNCGACEDEILVLGPGGEPYIHGNGTGKSYPTVLHVFSGEPALKHTPGMAVNNQGVLYVSEGYFDGEETYDVRAFEYVTYPTVALEKATVTEAGVTLRGSVNPEGEEVTECKFEYGTQAGEYTHALPCAPNAPLTGNKAVPVSAQPTELQPLTLYHFRLTAHAKFSTTREGVFFTATRPLVEGEMVSSSGSTEATVSATINGHGLPTTYRVEYGATEAYASRTPEASVGETRSAAGVVIHLTGLQPGSEYHFRVVAENEFGTARGSDTTFVTRPPSSVAALTLPDNRAHELVSAVEDTEVYVPAVGQGGDEEEGEFQLAGQGRSRNFRAASDGDAVAYIADVPASGVGGTGDFHVGDQYLAKRGARGWETGDIQFPLKAAEGLGGHYEDLSPDLSVLAGIDNHTLPEFPPPAGCEFATYSHTASGYHLLSSSADCGGALAGISANDSHVLFYPYNKTGTISDAVNEVPRQVDILPDGEPESHPNAIFGSSSDLIGDVSADGSRVFWTDLNTEATPEDPAGSTRLFVREDDDRPQSPVANGQCQVAGDACTVQVDAAQGGSGAGGGGDFWAASGDGSKVFFTDESQLAAGSTAASGAPDLYEYDVNAETGRPGSVIDLTVANTGHADVQSVIGASENGSYVYFLADGVLTQGPNVEGKEPVAGQPNLYMSHDGATTFIVTEPGILDAEEAEVAPGGDAVAFRSARRLTGYDNHGVSGYENDGVTVFEDLPEVFVYEANEAHIFCASCNPNGTPPVPSATEWEDKHNAYVGTSHNPSFKLRWINETGSQVYFMTNQPLVPQDTNEHQDVYEWEREGSGGCRQVAGCIAPLSDAGSPTRAFFIDASASGEDVFFTQRASLVAKAQDEDIKLYDARVDGGFPETALSCTGTGCQGVPAAPPIFATPSSVTFDGIGNFETPESIVMKAKAKAKSAKCKKGFVKKKGRCIRAKAKERKAKAKRVSNKRRAGR